MGGAGRPGWRGLRWSRRDSGEASGEGGKGGGMGENNVEGWWAPSRWSWRMGLINRLVLGVFLKWTPQVCSRFGMEIEGTRCVEAASRIWARERGGWSFCKEEGEDAGGVSFRRRSRAEFWP